MLEDQDAFDAEVTKRWALFTRTGHYLTIDDLRKHALAVVRGELPMRPLPRTLPEAVVVSIRALDH